MAAAGAGTLSAQLAFARGMGDPAQLGGEAGYWLTGGGEEAQKAPKEEDNE